MSSSRSSSLIGEEVIGTPLADFDLFEMSDPDPYFEDLDPDYFLPSEDKCSKCDRGVEACGYCNGLPSYDYEAICDCGLYDFGAHLWDCESMNDEEFIIK